MKTRDIAELEQGETLCLCPTVLIEVVEHSLGRMLWVALGPLVAGLEWGLATLASSVLRLPSAKVGKAT